MADTGTMILVCRPQPGADATVAALRDAGWQAEPVPVLGYRPVAEAPLLRTRVQALAEYDVVVFVSAAAVEHGMALIDRFWPELPVATSWVAVGEATRAALARWDLAAFAPSDERSEGMLALPVFERLDAGKVLIVRGRGGRGWLAEQLRARGLQVDFLEVYERVARSVNWPVAPERARALVVTSVAVLEAVLVAGGRRYRKLPVIVPSSRVAEAAQAAGFTRIEVAAGATPAETVAAVARCCG